MDTEEGKTDSSEPLEESRDGRFVKVGSRQYAQVLMKAEHKVVYSALNNETGCQVSWHELFLHHIPDEVFPSLKAELAVISVLRHDNIVVWVDHWLSRDRKTLIFITDLLPEYSLSGYLQKIGIPRTKVIRQWTRQILSGLSYLHSQSPAIVHSYLRPDSLYLVPHTGTVKIGGLGKVLVTHSAASRNAFNVRQEYLSPEVLRGIKIEAADVYSLGICLISMCTGKEPYEECGAPGAVFHHIVTGQKPQALSWIGNTDIVEFIEKCLKPLSDRPTVTQLLDSDFFTLSPAMSSQAILLKPVPELPVYRPAPSIDVEFVLHTPSLVSPKKISFAFDLESDTCDSVARELVQELNLQLHETTPLSHQIADRLYSSFFPQDCQTPSTNRESVTDSAEPEDEEYREERKCFRREESPMPSSSDSSEAVAGLSFSQYCLYRNLRNMRLLETSERMKSKELRIGVENDEDEVRILQIALSERYSLSLQANGVFSKKTEALVRRLQEDLGEEVTGVVSIELWEGLMECHRVRSDLPPS